jgi:hypothetical protein
MPPKRPHSPHRKPAALYQTAIDFSAPPPEPERRAEPKPAAKIEETGPDAEAYRVKDGYRNPYKRVVNWVILYPNGTELATVTTKRGACKIAELLNARDGQDAPRR